MSEGKIKVLIVDDHTVVRKGLKALLTAEKYGIDVVDEASNGNQAVEKAVQLEPDVILMDLVMPEKSGLEALVEIKQIQPEARILVLTSFAEDEKVVDAIRAGAFGFLLKDTSPDELVQTIRAVHTGKFTLPQELTRVLLANPAGAPEKPSTQADLTQREIDVLRCIAKGYANKQIASELSISTTTVRTHVSNLLRKLNFENRTQLALFARENELD